MTGALAHTLVCQLLRSKGKLTLCGGDLFLQLTLVKGLFSNDLSAQVLYLSCEFLLDGLVLLTHDCAPNRVQLVEDLRDARFAHLALVLFLNADDGADGFGRDPVVVHLGFG